MLLPKDLKYTKEHQWVKIQGDRVVVGITEYAQKELGDVVFIELPSTEEKVTSRSVMGTIESVKAVSELYAPVSGEITDTNDNLEHSPELINQDPYGKGWIVSIELSDPKELNELLTANAYASLIGAKE